MFTEHRYYVLSMPALSPIRQQIHPKNTPLIVISDQSHKQLQSHHEFPDF